MKSRTQVVLAAVVAALGGWLSAASADSIRVEGGPWQSGAGGEFKVTTLSGNAGVTGLPSDPLGAGTFQSFCLERDSIVNLGPGLSGVANVYNYVVGTAAFAGGYGGGGPEGDPISAATAYLYTQFRMGQLSAYAYNGTDDERKASAKALQIAIWALEDEYFGTGLNAQPANAQADAWILEANNAVAGAWGNTIGNVRVLVLTQGENAAQDILTLIPLPPAAWTGVASLVGLGTLGAIRRHRLQRSS
jgi:hypothetical protein